MRPLTAALAALALLPGVAGAATWEPVTFGMIGGSGAVYSIALDPSGGLFAGGSFESPCTAPWQLQPSPPTCPNNPVWPYPYTGIARWAGSGWSSMGVGLSGPTPFGADIQIGPDGRTYVAGPFDDAGPGTTNFLAVWNGLTWSSLGTGFLPSMSSNPNGYLNTMAFGSAGDLYVAGRFDSVDGVNASNVATWNGTSWSPVGLGPDPASPLHPIRSLAFAPDGTLYAGGNFNASGLAKWDGTTWSHEASGSFDTGANVLAINRRGTVYAGGHFNNPTRGIAQWDGASWSAVGSGLNLLADVTAIAIDHDGGVYVGGTQMLPVSGAPNVAQVAKWDGTTWTLLATSVTDAVVPPSLVDDLEIDPAGYLYAAGAFLAVDGHTTGQVARTVIAVPPGAPSTAGATTGGTSADVSWTAPSRNGAGTITGYTVTSEPDGKTCNWTSGPLQCTVSGLRYGTRYTFTVTAQNMAGAGAGTSVEATTSVEPATGSDATPASATAPRITRVVPATGPSRGGTRVAIRGSDLAGATRVTFGGTRTRIVRTSSDSVLAIAPAHAVGRVAVMVTTAAGGSTRQRAFRYLAPRPRVRPAVTG